MDHELRSGITVKYIGCSQEQINWGSNDDPRNILFVGDKYYVEHVEHHAYHTKIELRGIKGKFNSVCFELVEK
jgi:hypothetical protein